MKYFIGYHFPLSPLLISFPERKSFPSFVYSHAQTNMKAKQHILEKWQTEDVNYNKLENKKRKETEERIGATYIYGYIYINID